ncbi:MAG: hypothetical protein MI863_16375 [Desulfobacterales bacterium]|nr:hypothetical protein [Desulfobacterales bacterium]
MMEQSFMPYIGSFLWMSLLLLVSTWLRAKVSLFQQFLFPSAIIAGLLGFILMSLGWVGLPVAGTWKGIPHETFTMITTHLFAFGFVGIGLMSGDSGQKGKGKSILKGALWMTFLFLGMLYFQSVIGVGVMLGWEAITGQGLTSAVGFLAGHGFTQGPGQALAIAGGWEKMGLQDCISMGLAFSAVGFFVAALVGVPIANWGIRKGYTTHRSPGLSKEFLAGLEAKSARPPGLFNVTTTSNVDSLSFHLAIMGLVYGLGFGLSYLLRYYIFPKEMWGATFGFLFAWGLVMAILFRKALNACGGRDMIDENTLRRLTGTTVDFMVISVMMAVQVTTLQKYMVPFLIVTLILAVITPAVILYLGRRVGEFGFERSLVMLGYCTGTGASGLLLLRIVDPEFKTTAAVETGLMNLFCLLSLPLLFLIFLMPKYGLGFLLKAELLMGGAMFLIMFVCHKLKYFGPKQY